MTIARRSHLFPSRTQKLSSLAPMILGGKLPGKVGRCRFFYFLENVKMTTFTVRLTIARSAGNVSPFRKVRFPMIQATLSQGRKPWNSQDKPARYMDASRFFYFWKRRFLLQAKHRLQFFCVINTAVILWLRDYQSIVLHHLDISDGNVLTR